MSVRDQSETQLQDWRLPEVGPYIDRLLEALKDAMDLAGINHSVEWRRRFLAAHDLSEHDVR